MAPHAPMSQATNRRDCTMSTTPDVLRRILAHAHELSLQGTDASEIYRESYDMRLYRWADIPVAADRWAHWRDAPGIVETMDVPYPYWDPAEDVIKLPPHRHFTSALRWWSTLFHEGAHATGHPSRLARPAIAGGLLSEGQDISHAARAQEEITVELSSALTMERLGLTPCVETAGAYVQNWAYGYSGRDRSEILAAAVTDAIAATEYILAATA